MREIKIGDFVARRSYNYDVLFKVNDVLRDAEGNVLYILKGVNMRIIADAPAKDLMLQDKSDIEKFERDNQRAVMKGLISAGARYRNRGVVRDIKERIRDVFLYKGEEPLKRPGRILHLDGDEDYLNICSKAYEDMGLYAEGEYVPEDLQPRQVAGMLRVHLPDILVLTGHDAIGKGKDKYNIRSYRNSGYYVAAVKEARGFEPSYDDLVIFAGACQSHFEAILAAGANYASSPKRVLIHALDPVFICQGIACTSIDSIVPVRKLVSKTVAGLGGIGGLETRGKYREGIPGPGVAGMG